MSSSDLSVLGDVSASTARQAWMLRMYTFAIYTTQALLVSYFPLYFLSKGFNEQQIGVLYSSGPLISIVANLLMGAASDKYRTIRKVLIVLLFGQLAAAACLLPASSFWLVVTIMFVFYFCQTPTIPLTDSLIVLASPHIKQPYALIRIFGSIGFCLSAYFLGLILRAVGTQWTVAVCICTIVATLFITFLIRDYQGTMRKMEFSGFFRLVRKPDIVLFFLIVLIVSIAHRMNEGFLGVTMHKLGASDTLVGAAWSMSSLSEIPILYLMGKYGHRYKELPLLFFASVLYAVRFWLNGNITSPYGFVFTQLLHSVTFGIFFSTALRYIAQIIPDEYRSSGMALFAIVWTGFAGVFSGLIGGYLYQRYGSGLFFDIASALSLLAGLLFIGKHVLARR